MFFASLRLMRAMKSRALNSRRLSFVMALLFALTITGWGKADLRPSWRLEPVARWDGNLSFLSDLSERQASSPLASLMDAQWARDKQIEYDRVVREYELKQRYRLAGHGGDLAQRQWLRDFSAQILDQVRMHNFIRGRNSATDYLRKNVRLRINVDGIVRQSAAVAAFFVAAGMGTPLMAQLAPDAELTAYANLPYRTTYLQLKSPLLNGALTYVSEPSPKLPFDMPGPPDWVNRNEVYSVRASRTLPIWGLGSSVVYGGSSYMVTSSLTKQLTPQLSAALDASIPADMERSASKTLSQTLHFDYKMSF